VAGLPAENEALRKANAALERQVHNLERELAEAKRKERPQVTVGLGPLGAMRTKTERCLTARCPAAWP
jgi:hypothetical protein